jgi:hypothetical protein
MAAPIRVLITLFLMAATLTLGQGVANADYPHDSCTGATEGDVVTRSNETWECGYDGDIEDYIWKPAFQDTTPPNYWIFSYGWSLSNTGIYEHGTRSRIEFLPDGVHSGADDFSYRNGSRWSTTHVAESFLYYWDGSTWVQCGGTGQVSGSGSFRYAPTWGWNAACGENRYYATTAWSWQWTGSAWNGSSAWSGFIWAPCRSGCLAAADPPAPPAGKPPVETATPPAGPPGKVKLHGPTGRATASMLDG